ncbi:BA75_04152T0 [Komagataella pastoris]|uniref:BA75_04152T0 n=1 Tax=Komagataella pastoris TaxID=4922 RepID=A0A1B2JEI5_PICPA|nr:BA75_04152T0 [Komagataella pastoris]
MQYYLATPNTPFVDGSTIPSGSGAYGRANSNSSNTFCHNYHGKEELSDDPLTTDFLDPSIDDVLLYSILSPIMTANTEQPQEPQNEQQSLSSCYQEMLVQTEEQQQLDLLPDMHPENIFNSESSMFVYSNIPQRNSVHSLISVNTSTLASDPAEGRTLSYVETIGSSFDHPVEDSFSYGMNSAESTLPSSARSSVELDLLPTVAASVPSVTSLEAVINSKRQKMQFRQHNRIEELNSTHGINAQAPVLLNYSSLPLVRGLSSGGNNSRPPKEPLIPGAQYITAHLRLENSSCEDMCLPEWNEDELKDCRRIIRIERKRHSNEIVASFSIVGSATQNPQIKPSSDSDVQVMEVSCLQCLVNHDETDEEKQVDNESSPNETQHSSAEPPKSNLNRKLSGSSHRAAGSSVGCQYYITSVEVIKIIELLVGSHLIQDSQQKRKERGRVRSNLVPFWSKHPVSSSKKTLRPRSGPACNDDYLAELAHRIMTYEIRRPRIFDKNVRILEWAKLGPALQRALQSYYVAVPLDESENKRV